MSEILRKTWNKGMAFPKELCVHEPRTSTCFFYYYSVWSFGCVYIFKISHEP